MEYKYTTEDQLLEDLRKGDKVAITYAYQEYWPMGCSHVLNNSGDNEDAEDCYQEAFIIFLEKIRKKKFERKSKLSSFLIGILKNLWSNHLRKRKSVNHKMIKYRNEQETNPEEEEFDLPTEKDILEKIQSLNEDCMNILIDFYYKKLSMQEIAEKMKMPTANAVRQRKFDCMRELKKLFGTN